MGMEASVKVVTASKTYNLKGKLSQDTHWKLAVEGDLAGPVEGTVSVKSDFREAKVQIMRLGKKVLQLKLKGQKRANKTEVQC